MQFYIVHIRHKILYNHVNERVVLFGFFCFLGNVRKEIVGGRIARFPLLCIGNTF